MLKTCLNIAYAIFFYSYFLARLNKAYKALVKKIFKYFKKTINIELVYYSKL